LVPERILPRKDRENKGAWPPLNFGEFFERRSGGKLRGKDSYGMIQP